jgi:hypothetical protein
VEIRRRLAAANPAVYEPALAMALTNLSIDLADVGRRDEGLAAIEEAVEVRRRLAAANPAAYEPALADSLNNLSIDLAEVGRRDEAATARSTQQPSKSGSDGERRALLLSLLIAAGEPRAATNGIRATLLGIARNGD